jgi:hypothetical protein
MLTAKILKGPVRVGTTYKIVKMTPNSPAELALAYTREWVTRNPISNLKISVLNDFIQRYKDAQKLLL